VNRASPSTAGHTSRISGGFEDDYLSSDLEPVRAFFSLAASYAALKRSMGDGYATERWLAAGRFEDLETALRPTWDQLHLPETTL
jgi:hypothetical protein